MASFTLLYVKIIYTELTCGILSNRMILFRRLRHERCGRHANDRDADAASAANPLAKRWHSQLGNGQQHANAATVVTTAPTTNTGHAAKQ